MNIALTGEKDLLEQARKALIEMGYEQHKWNERMYKEDWDTLWFYEGYVCYLRHVPDDSRAIPLTHTNFNEVINQFKK